MEQYCKLGRFVMQRNAVPSVHAFKIVRRILNNRHELEIAEDRKPTVEYAYQGRTSGVETCITSLRLSTSAEYENA